MSLKLHEQITHARELLKAAVQMWGEAAGLGVTKPIARQRERRAMALYAQAQVHATIAVYEKLEALTKSNDRPTTAEEFARFLLTNGQNFTVHSDGTIEFSPTGELAQMPSGQGEYADPKWLDDMTTTDEVLTEPTVKRPWKRDALIRWVQQFDGGSNFYLQNGKVIVTTPTGRAVKPRFWYPSSPLLSIKVGTRVRKFEYSDTGTVVRVDTAPGAVPFKVKWDTSGESWEGSTSLGVAVEH